MEKLSMFLPKDQEQADKELDCYNYLLANAIELMLKGEFAKAAVYHSNIARSLDELDRLKRNKQIAEEAKDLLEQINKQDAIRRHWF
ncbi:hypothetical protein GCM10008934_25110 [Virgibacillus salarius]|uniref:hypothetical protein n=1 Tax=Virgibacillus salarius TaxID=447199 RepID=UPI0031DF7F18